MGIEDLYKEAFEEFLEDHLKNAIITIAFDAVRIASAYPQKFKEFLENADGDFEGDFVYQFVDEEGVNFLTSDRLKAAENYAASTKINLKIECSQSEVKLEVDYTAHPQLKDALDSFKSDFLDYANLEDYIERVHEYEGESSTIQRAMWEYCEEHGEGAFDEFYDSKEYTAAYQEFVRDVFNFDEALEYVDDSISGTGDLEIRLDKIISEALVNADNELELEGIKITIHKHYRFDTRNKEMSETFTNLETYVQEDLRELAKVENIYQKTASSLPQVLIETHVWIPDEAAPHNIVDNRSISISNTSAKYLAQINKFASSHLISIVYSSDLATYTTRFSGQESPTTLELYVLQGMEVELESSFCPNSDIKLYVVKPHLQPFVFIDELRELAESYPIGRELVRVYTETYGVPNNNVVVSIRNLRVKPHIGFDLPIQDIELCRKFEDYGSAYDDTPLCNQFGELVGRFPRRSSGYYGGYGQSLYLGVFDAGSEFRTIENKAAMKLACTTTGEISICSIQHDKSYIYVDLQDATYSSIRIEKTYSAIILFKNQIMQEADAVVFDIKDERDISNALEYCKSVDLSNRESPICAIFDFDRFKIPNTRFKLELTTNSSIATKYTYNDDKIVIATTNPHFSWVSYSKPMYGGFDSLTELLGGVASDLEKWASELTHVVDYYLSPDNKKEIRRGKLDLESNRIVTHSISALGTFFEIETDLQSDPVEVEAAFMRALPEPYLPEGILVGANKLAGSIYEFAQILGATQVHILNVQKPTMFKEVRDSNGELKERMCVGDDYTYDVDIRLGKNINFLATSCLALWVPQMLARFEEHMQANVAIQKAPLGVAMDVVSGTHCPSPRDFLIAKDYGILWRFFQSKFDGWLGPNSGIYCAPNVVGLDGHKPAIRYLYSFIDFYTKPLALLHNVALNPQQHGVRENPYLKEEKALSCSYAIKPMSKWLDVYKQALGISQRDTSWSHLMNLESVSVTDVERELELFSQNATVFEYDDLFDAKDDSKTRFETFMDEESYRGGDILPEHLREFEVNSAFEENIEAYLSDLKSPSKIKRGYFYDPQGGSIVDIFSQKLNASIEFFSKVWTFKFATGFTDISKSKFFKNYVKGSNPNIKHVVDISGLLEMGTFSTSMKKILDNKSVQIGAGEKEKLCGANFKKNVMPYYPMHYSLKIFPRIKGSVFGNLPSEAQNAQTTDERLSLGAYVTILNFIRIAQQAIMADSLELSQFGPVAMRKKITEATSFVVIQQNGFPSTNGIKLEPAVQGFEKNEIRERLAEVTKNYNICIGQMGQKYVRNTQNGDAHVFGLFQPSTMDLFASIYYENGKLNELNAQENCLVGTNPNSGTTLYKYRRESLSMYLIEQNLDFRKAHFVYNFLMYAHFQNPNEYRINTRLSDFEMPARTLVTMFENAFNARRLSKLDYLPQEFVQRFERAFEQYKIQEGNAALNANDYLPSAVFVEMCSYFESANLSIDSILEYLKKGDNYFGAFDDQTIADLNRLQDFSTSWTSTNETFDLDWMLEQPTILESFKADGQSMQIIGGQPYEHNEDADYDDDDYDEDDSEY